MDSVDVKWYSIARLEVSHVPRVPPVFELLDVYTSHQANDFTLAAIYYAPLYSSDCNVPLPLEPWSLLECNGSLVIWVSRCLRL